jgi:hypothetical protein
MDTNTAERSPTSKTKNTCAELLAIEPALWTFVRVAGVEPTNNAAERALRHAVMVRKISSGSHTEDGIAWMARLPTRTAPRPRAALAPNSLSYRRLARRRPDRRVTPIPPNIFNAAT